MTDAKIVELERESMQTLPALSCPLQLNVMDPDERLWPLLKVKLHNSSQLQLKKLNDQDFLPKGERQVLLLVDHPVLAPVYDELERKAGESRSLIFMGDPANTVLVRRAMRMGAADFLPQNSDPIELWSALVRISAQVSASISLAPVTVVINGKGGSGASFVCANLGHAFQSSDEKVLLLDACRHYGSLADYLNIRDKQGGLNDALQRASEMDAMALAGMVSKARDGMDVMPASVLPLHDENTVSARQCAQLLHLMRGQYQRVVVDMSRGPEAWNLPLLENAEQVVVVMQQSLSALRETIFLLRQLRHELGIGKDRILLLVNRYDKKKDVSLQEIEKATEIKRITTLANDFAMAETCTDLGRLVAEEKRNHKLVEGFNHLSSALKPGHERDDRPGLFKRLFGN
ncbi:cellulose synthase operon protein YhjQ/BcsQ [Oceanimonas pelagia]|uniref:Cellulose synthase operon protein YhjQ/BcsQ n=1 Tax=Oceanimonas pelagia TaxID=3028314 RepID=A0AA50KQK5_9GAMM|nr:cellulose synthase operon protein YhjQ/BcsQ [Oceanimonas pelagia]WMC11894.1 cellulose synthase operon protein YhjQ/BcsQ [Oceanimonas pelagia]